MSGRNAVCVLQTNRLSQSSTRSDDIVAVRPTRRFAARDTTTAGSFVDCGRRRSLPWWPYHFARRGVGLVFRGRLDLGPAEGQQHLPIGPAGRESQQPPVDGNLPAADAEKPAEVDDGCGWMAVGGDDDINHKAQILAVRPDDLFS